MELAFFSIVLLFIWNSYQYSNRYLKTVEDRAYRYLYYSNMGSGIEQDEAVNAKEEIAKRLEHIVYEGISTIEQGVMFLNDTKHFEAVFRVIESREKETEPEAEDVQLMEEAVAPYAYYYDWKTIQTFQMEMQKGSWFQESHQKLYEQGITPCVIGGDIANQYKIGQEIKGEAFGIDNKKVSNKLQVIGILKSPQFLLNNGVGSSTTIQIKDIFRNVLEQEPFLILPREYSDIKLEDSSSDNCFVYFDKNTSDETLEEAAEKLGRGCVTLDSEMIALEQEDVKEFTDQTIPFVLCIFVVSFIGILAMTLLISIQNQKTFGIYYLVGATKTMTVKISVIFHFLYLLFSTLFTLSFLPIARAKMGFQAFYLYLDDTFLWMLAGIYMTILLCSIGIPFYLIKNNKTTIEQLNGV